MMRRAFAFTALCGAAGYAAVRAQARAHLPAFPLLPLDVPAEMRATEVAAGPIHIVPVGPFNEGRLAFLRRVVEVVYGAPCRLERPVPVPPELYTLGRAQLDADGMLGLLVDHFPGDASRVLAVTESDLYAAGRPYVFGYGHLRDRVAIVSTARLDERSHGQAVSEQLLLTRLYKAVVHEIGHTAGDPHCGTELCIMREVADLAALDSLPLGYCTECLLRVRREMQVPPHSAEAQFSLGAALLRRHRYERAVGALERAASRDPANAVYQNDLGVALLRQGERRAALRAFARARRLRPDLPEPAYNLRLCERGMVARWEPETASAAGR